MTTKGKWLALEKKLHERPCYFTLDLPWLRTKRFYEVFPPKIGGGQFKATPEPWAKSSRGLFQSRLILVAKKLYVYTDVLDLFKPRLIFARINGLNVAINMKCNS